MAHKWTNLLQSVLEIWAIPNWVKGQGAKLQSNYTFITCFCVLEGQVSSHDKVWAVSLVAGSSEIIPTVLNKEYLYILILVQKLRVAEKLVNGVKNKREM